MYIRQLAWLSVIPQGKSQTRMETMQQLDEDADLNLPEVHATAYLIDALNEIGQARMTGDRMTSIDWQEIESWKRATDSSMRPWELRAIKSLSEAYVSQYYASLKPGEPQPNSRQLPDKDVVTSRLKSLFSMMRKR